MELDKLFKLIDAGFTKEEILNLTQSEAPAEEKKEETGENTPKEEKPAEEAKKAPEEPKENEQISALLAEVQAMREDLRKRSLLEDGYRPENSMATAEQILADVIDPPALKKSKGGKK